MTWYFILSGDMLVQFEGVNPQMPMHLRRTTGAENTILAVAERNKKEKASWRMGRKG